jgi:hypothetical protein
MNHHHLRGVDVIEPRLGDGELLRVQPLALPSQVRARLDTSRDVADVTAVA